MTSSAQVRGVISSVTSYLPVEVIRPTGVGPRLIHFLGRTETTSRSGSQLREHITCSLTVLPFKYIYYVIILGFRILCQ